MNRNLAAVVFFLLGTFIGAAEPSGKPQAESYALRTLKAVTFIVDAKGNPSLTSISLTTIRRIYDCTITNWKDVPGSDRTDKILPLAMIGAAADATKLLEKRISQFKLGPCVTTIAGPDPSAAVFFAIGTVPPNRIGATENFNAIGYLNYGPLRDGHKPLAIIDDLAKKKPRPPIAPTDATIKDKSYVLMP
jgi:ABC-type phosphate transport system substrate-binding protein